MKNSLAFLLLGLILSACDSSSSDPAAGAAAGAEAPPVPLSPTPLPMVVKYDQTTPREDVVFQLCSLLNCRGVLPASRNQDNIVLFSNANASPVQVSVECAQSKSVIFSLSADKEGPGISVLGAATTVSRGLSVAFDSDPNEAIVGRANLNTTIYLGNSGAPQAGEYQTTSVPLEQNVAVLQAQMPVWEMTIENDNVITLVFKLTGNARRNYLSGGAFPALVPLGAAVDVTMKIDFARQEAEVRTSDDTTNVGYVHFQPIVLRDAKKLEIVEPFPPTSTDSYSDGSTADEVISGLCEFFKRKGYLNTTLDLATNTPLFDRHKDDTVGLTLQTKCSDNSRVVILLHDSDIWDDHLLLGRRLGLRRFVGLQFKKQFGTQNADHTVWFSTSVLSVNYFPATADEYLFSASSTYNREASYFRAPTGFTIRILDDRVVVIDFMTKGDLERSYADSGTPQYLNVKPIEFTGQLRFDVVTKTARYVTVTGDVPPDLKLIEDRP